MPPQKEKQVLHDKIKGIKVVRPKVFRFLLDYICLASCSRKIELKKKKKKTKHFTNF